MTDIRSLVADLLRARGPIPEGLALDAFDYIDSGHVDSLAVMKFIVSLEAALDIELTDDDIESQAFRTVGGLAALLERRVAERAGGLKRAAS